MPEEMDNNTQQYVQPETVEQSKEETVEQAPQAKKEENQREYNFKLIRERAETAERRAADLEKIIHANINSQSQSQKLQVVEEDDEEIGISDDTYIEGKDFKKYVKSLKRELKATKKQFEEMHKKSSMEQAEVRLKSQFNDFDTVVSQENLERLAHAKPALYRSIMANSDIYDRGYTAYELIKNSGISANDFEQQDRRLEDNKSKPRSAASAASQSGDTPLARVGDYDRRVLTEERKEQLRRQVEEAKRYK